MSTCSTLERIRFIFATLMIFTSLPVIALDDIAFSPVGKLVESLQPTRPVSGDLVAGFMGPNPITENPPRLAAWIPFNWVSQEICTLIRSRDGRYEAYQTFQVSDNWSRENSATESDQQNGAFKNFELKDITEHKYLRGAVNDLAVLVHLGHCGSETITSTLAFWGGVVPSAITDAQLFLNTKRAEEALLYFDTLDLEVPCVPIDAADRQAFDFHCTLPDKILNSGGLIKAEVTRIIRGNYEPLEIYSFFLPEPAF